MKILHVASECAPFSKTGGLADVVGALPFAQASSGDDVRVVLPAYSNARNSLVDAREAVRFSLRNQEFVLIEGHLTGNPVTYWLLDCPALFSRPGSPYHDEQGAPHADNAWRFGCFAEVAARLSLAGVNGWCPDLVHCHDWHAALTAAWLGETIIRPRTVLTIHNLAYQGVCEWNEFAALQLPKAWWHVDIGEFWGGFSFLKAGLMRADAVTTVSTTYAREIATPSLGCGLDDRLHRCIGILNGIDTAVWNPATDLHLPQRYDAASVQAGKAANKAVLQAEFGLPVEPDVLLVGMVSRLAAQKGIDALLAGAEGWCSMPLQVVVLGVGDADLEQGLLDLAAAMPNRLAVRLSFDERLAHLIEAGADAFLMPSRFEPCGMNQMYSQRYGTVPLVRRVGGLADTVVDATETALEGQAATGITFNDCDAQGVCYGLDRALELYRTPHWYAMQQRGMASDFSWQHAALRYRTIYQSLMPAASA